MAVDLAVLGPFDLTCQGEQVDFSAASARALLAFLAIESDRSHTRAYLASLLWPDRPEPAALTNLRQALSRIRKGLPGEVGAHIVRSTGSGLRYGLSPTTVDLHRLDQLLANCSIHEHSAPHHCALCFARRQEALALYRGEVMQGLQLDGSQPMEDWLRIQRERTKAQIVESLAVQTAYLRSAGEFQLMAQTAARQVDVDPWRERGYRDLILAHALQGDRVAALAQFQRCELQVAEELGAPLEAATLRLRDDLLALSGESFTRRYLTENEPRRVERQAAHESLLLTHDHPLIGRDQEVRSLVELLNKGQTRLLTLTGPGGVGKTRLAEAVLTALGNVSPVEIRSVSLEAVQKHEHVVFALADALDIIGGGMDSLVTRLAHSLATRRVVLLIDNADHVLDAAPLLARLVRDCPGLALLVTSRRALRVAGERVFVVPPLPVGNPNTGEPGGAVDLLVESAARNGCSRVELERDIEVARAICMRLDGLPLAIELATAKLSVLTPAELLVRLERQLPLLTDGPRSAPQRQRTMRSTIAWGYGLLNAEEQQVFRHLAVFPAEFTLDLAETVCTAASPPAISASDATVIDRIVTLRGASLVTDAEQGGGSRRFRLLEVIREFAEEHLVEHGELEVAWTAHADALIARFGGKPIAPYAPDDLARDTWLESEFQNLRAVLSRLDSLGDTRRYGTLAGLVGWYWFVRGRLSEGQAVLERAAEHLDDLPPTLVANITVVLAKIRLSVGQISSALELLQSSLATAEQTGDAFTGAQVMVARGVEATSRSDPADASSWFEAAMARAGLIRQDDVRIAMGSVIRSLQGVIAREAGQLELARHLHLMAIQGHGQVRSLRGEMFAWVNLGDVQRQQGDVALALTSYGNAIELARPFADHRVLGLAASSIGQILTETSSQHATGRVIAQSAWNHMQQLGLRSRVPHQHLPRPDPAAVIPAEPIDATRHGLAQLPFEEVVDLALKLVRNAEPGYQIGALNRDSSGVSR